MNQNEQMRDEIQAAYDYMDSAIQQSRHARHELDHWKTECEKLSHECARLSLVIARLKEQALVAEPAPLVRLTQIERDRIAMSCQSTQQVISATIDAMIAKNGGKV